MLASETEVVMGFGRWGAVLGPWAGGILFKAGFLLSFVEPIMSLGSAISGLSPMFLGKTMRLFEKSKIQNFRGLAS